MSKSTQENYRPLLQHDENDQVDEELFSKSANSELTNPSRPILRILIFFLLFVSVAFNAKTILTGNEVVVASCETEKSECTSEWARVTHNSTQPFYSDTEYGLASTAEERKKLWQSLDISMGLIAIPHKWAKERGLPRSQNFPWDPSLGLYYPAVFHQIHCLKDIYSWLSPTQKDVQPEVPHEHIMHCMGSLSQDVYCHADDVPWYQPPPDPEAHGYQNAQTRQCKDWGMLSKLVEEHNACYKHDVDEGWDFLQHFHFCPEGSPYEEVMEKHFELKAPGAKGKTMSL